MTNAIDGESGSALSVRVAAKVMAFAARGASRIERDVLRRHGLGAAEWRIVSLLSDSASRRPEEIAADCLLAELTVGEALARLNERGIVTQDPQAGRVALNRFGVELFHAVQPEVIESGSREFATLSMAELEALYSHLSVCESRARFRLAPAQI